MDAVTIDNATDEHKTRAKVLFVTFSLVALVTSFLAIFFVLKLHHESWKKAVNAAHVVHGILYQDQDWDPDLKRTNDGDPVTVYTLPTSHIVHVDIFWFRVEGSWVRILKDNDPDVRSCQDSASQWDSVTIATNGDWRTVPPPPDEE